MDPNELMSCKICGNILNDPIRLPCNKYICKMHENDCEKREMECILCYQIHLIPENGWQIDDTMKSLINHLKTIHCNIVQDENYKHFKEKINIYENNFED